MALETHMPTGATAVDLEHEIEREDTTRLTVIMDRMQRERSRCERLELTDEYAAHCERVLADILKLTMGECKGGFLRIGESGPWAGVVSSALLAEMISGSVCRPDPDQGYSILWEDETGEGDEIWAWVTVSDAAGDLPVRAPR